jgi:pimeloyl-ACP methyl ester carboxylesterase
MAMLTSRPTDMPVNFADDIEAFMDAVGLQSAVLLGSSSGGYVAQQVAVQVPHRVGGLVLVGAPRSLQCRPAFGHEVDRLTDPVDPSWVEESLTWFPRYHDVPDWYIKDRIRDGLRVPAHVWIAGLARLTTAVPPSESGTITAPTLIIWGERDELLPLQDGYLLAAAIPGSRLIVYEDTGHLVLWEQPNEWPRTWPTSSAGFQRRVRTARRSRKVRQQLVQRKEGHAHTTSAPADHPAAVHGRGTEEPESWCSLTERRPVASASAADTPQRGVSCTR